MGKSWFICRFPGISPIKSHLLRHPNAICQVQRHVLLRMLQRGRVVGPGTAPCASRMGPPRYVCWLTKAPGTIVTLWLCQNSYWKLWFIVDFPINSMVIFHSYVSSPEGTQVFVSKAGELSWISWTCMKSQSLRYRWDDQFWSVGVLWWPCE